MQAASKRRGLEWWIGDGWLEAVDAVQKAALDPIGAKPTSNSRLDVRSIQPVAATPLASTHHHPTPFSGCPGSLPLAVNDGGSTPLLIWPCLSNARPGLDSCAAGRAAAPIMVTY
jgi:hypothetical protein